MGRMDWAIFVKDGMVQPKPMDDRPAPIPEQMAKELQDLCARYYRKTGNYVFVEQVELGDGRVRDALILGDERIDLGEHIKGGTLGAAKRITALIANL